VGAHPEDADANFLERWRYRVYLPAMVRIIREGEGGSDLAT
jgi:hypothetical protein